MQGTEEPNINGLAAMMLASEQRSPTHVSDPRNVALCTVLDVVAASEKKTPGTFVVYLGGYDIVYQVDEQGRVTTYWWKTTS